GEELDPGQPERDDKSRAVRAGCDARDARVAAVLEDRDVELGSLLGITVEPQAGSDLLVCHGSPRQNSRARPHWPAPHLVVDRPGRGSTRAAVFSGPVRAGRSTPHGVFSTGFAPPSKLPQSHPKEPTLRLLLGQSQRPLVSLLGFLPPPQPPQ